MEARIKRGRLLREILKQDRLTPLSNLFQLAWLIAFNTGLFNELDIKELASSLKRIEQGVNTTSLTMDSPQEQWQQAISQWLIS
jgi:F-type H+-transporting ATPase subunit alpha